jgi:hypothetical protein
MNSRLYLYLFIYFNYFIIKADVASKVANEALLAGNQASSINTLYRQSLWPDQMEQLRSELAAANLSVLATTAELVQCQVRQNIDIK